MKNLISYLVVSTVISSSVSYDFVSQFLLGKFVDPHSLTHIPNWYMYEVVTAYLEASQQKTGDMMKYLNKRLAHLDKQVRDEIAYDHIKKHIDAGKDDAPADAPAGVPADEDGEIPTDATDSIDDYDVTTISQEEEMEMEKQMLEDMKRAKQKQKEEMERAKEEMKKEEEEKRNQVEAKRREMVENCVFDVVGTVNRFHFNMQEHVLTDKSANSVYSPLSIYFSLAMMSLGASKETKRQINSALAWKAGDADGMDSIKYIVQAFNYTDVVNIASNGWLSSEIQPTLDFLRKVKENFGVELGRENFGNSEVARTRINKWVSNHTGGNIRELFPRNSISSMTKFVLANAIYFNGKWIEPFPRTSNQVSHFHGADNERIPGVTFMWKTGVYSYGRTADNVELLELPYKEGFSMFFAKPMHPEDFSPIFAETLSFTDIYKLSTDIDETTFDNWFFNNMEQDEIDACVPKFSTNQDMNDLEAKLQKLGISDAFSRRRADFSEMSDGENVYVSSAVHKATVDVDEEGTKASAATGFVITEFSARDMVKINRPFLFYILKKPCNTVIFSGRIMNPLL